MNRNFLLAFNIVLLILVGVLFYLHFSPSSTTAAAAPSRVMDNSPASPFKIAYFEMDSIEKNYNYFKDVRNELKAKENDMNNQLATLKNRYMDKVTKFQQEAQTMTQERQGTMQQELLQEQKMVQGKEQSLGLELQDASFNKMQTVNKAIEDFLTEYNKDKGYSYILGYQPGTIYYKDSRYDITGPILEGLNARYQKKK